jgi:hypothetical protein
MAAGKSLEPPVLVMLEKVAMSGRPISHEGLAADVDALPVSHRIPRRRSRTVPRARTRWTVSAFSLSEASHAVPGKDL